MAREIQVKSVLNKKKKRDSWFLDEYTLNPYEGCSFNCLYCYVRGSKYGENMEEGLNIKSNALEVLDRQLAFRVRKNQYGIIALASATDPYMSIESKYKLTQGFLQLIVKHEFPVLVITKSTLVTRDIPLLKEIDQKGRLPEDLKKGLHHAAIVSFSLSTLDEGIAKKLEPGAPSPQQRLEAMQQCKEEGLFVGLNCIPTLPFLTDSDEQIENMVVAAKKYKADYLLMGGLTLFGNGPADSKTLYYQFLEKNYPHLLSEYKRLYRIFPMPPKNYNESLDQRIQSFCTKHGIQKGILAYD